LLVRPNGEARGAHTAMVVVLERRAWRLAAWYA
jgi:hypothetical protein